MVSKLIFIKKDKLRICTMINHRNKAFGIIFILMLISIFSNLVFIKSRIPEETEISVNKLKQSSLTVTSPIIINEDQDWIDLKNQGLCTGQGILGDPYIINNLSINGNGSHCILLSSVRNVYYKIMNCKLYNGLSGIRVIYADMGDIIGNNISYNGIGISTFPYNSNYAQNKYITDNIISHNSDVGIEVNWFTDVVIYNNQISHNKDGIMSGFLNERLIISNNNVSNNIRCGLWISQANNSYIIENIINYNGRGIFLIATSNTLISNNQIHYSRRNYDQYSNYGIFLYSNSNFNIIENNYLSDNHMYELYFDDSSNNTIRYNIVTEYYNYMPNFYFFEGTSEGNIFENNIVSWDDYLEYNDVFIDAKAIATEFINDNLIAIDEDWYRVALLAGNTYIITINFLSSEDPLKIYLYSSTQQLLSQSTPSSHSSVISYDIINSDDYYIRISNGFNSNYSIIVELYNPDLINPVITEKPEDFTVFVDYTSRSISWKATDLNPNLYTIELQGVGVVEGPNLWYNGQKITYAIPSRFSAGNYVYTIVFTDDSNNAVSDTVTLTVLENTSRNDSIPGYEIMIIIGILSLSVLFLNKKTNITK